MKFVKEGLVSGNAVIEGYKTDGRFIPADAIPIYLDYLYISRDNPKAEFQIDWVGDYDLQLVSLIAGNGNPSQKLNSVKSQDLTGSFTYWRSNMGNPEIPYKFQPGILIPSKSRLVIDLSAKASYFRLLVSPIITELAGSVVTLDTVPVAF